MDDRNERLAWGDLKVFLALVRARSLMGAARQLGVEHSTVSRRIGGLEAALGLRLFDRLPRGWRPTSEGERLVEQAEAVEREITALTRMAAGIDPLRGEVRITAPPVLLALMVVPELASLKASYPHLTPILVGTRRVSDLDRAEADIALRLGDVSDPNLVSRRIGSVGYGLYGRPEHVARPASDRVYLAFDDSLSDLPQADWLESRARGASIVVRSNDMTVLMEAARSGLGLAMLPHFAARSAPELIPAGPSLPAETRPLHLVMQSDVRHAPRVRLVADHLAASFKSALNHSENPLGALDHRAPQSRK